MSRFDQHSTVISRLLPFMKELYKGLLRPKHMVDGAQFDTSVPIRAERLYGLVQQAVMARPAPVTGEQLEEVRRSHWPVGIL